MKKASKQMAYHEIALERKLEQRGASKRVVHTVQHTRKIAAAPRKASEDVYRK